MTTLLHKVPPSFLLLLLLAKASGIRKEISFTQEAEMKYNVCDLGSSVGSCNE